MSDHAGKRCWCGPENLQIFTFLCRSWFCSELFTKSAQQQWMWTKLCNTFTAFTEKQPHFSLFMNYYFSLKLNHYQGTMFLQKMTAICCVLLQPHCMTSVKEESARWGKKWGRIQKHFVSVRSDVFTAHLRTVSLFLPPYSPFLNPTGEILILTDVGGLHPPATWSHDPFGPIFRHICQWVPGIDQTKDIRCAHEPHRTVVFLNPSLSYSGVFGEYILWTYTDVNV